ncbi:NRPS-like enzyme [Pleurostoma richardsiae]|uniref:NRPS-like enzyme n=1 Tax=Pleurostoma richardsiae TaxID=41990 RepID=A0AA38RJW0_9PEZI|nr:NRPS-like enzyme [Pleurostoma richardsiae]
MEDLLKPMSPDYGRRLVNKVIDERAAAKHARPYASIPVSDDVSAGFKDISYSQFANAIDRCARWLQTQDGLTSTTEPLVYIGLNDLRYSILALATAKTGHIMFFVSPRNSLEAHLSLLEQAKTSTFLTPEEYDFPLMSQIESQRPLRKFTIPSLEDLLSAEPVDPVPFRASFEEVRLKPWLILHTSGSTGIPKIITLPYGWLSVLDAIGRVEDTISSFQSTHKRVFAPFPTFHAAGIVYSLGLCIWLDATIVFPPPTAPMTSDVVNAIHVHGRVESSVLPPSLVVDLAKEPEYLETLHNLHSLAFAGGPLPDAVGDALCQRLMLFSLIGATEWASVPMCNKPAEDWAYFGFNTKVAGIEFREAGEDRYELVFVRKPECELFQAVFRTFPNLDEYHTKDIYSRHPTKPGLWKHEGRLDDVIVLTNGEKVNPVTMEQVITSCPVVKGCLVVGQARFQTAALIEPVKYPVTEEEVRQLMETVLPFVQRANEDAPQHARIVEDMIMFTKEDKPLPRAPKGTVQRQKANEVYKEEVEAHYQAFSDGGARNSLSLSFENTDSAIESLKAYVEDLLGRDGIGIDDDFFKIGMDSLQVMSLSRAINQGLDDDEDASVAAKDIYGHPTIRGLVSYVQNIGRLKGRSEEEKARESWEAMERAFQEAVRGLPRGRVNGNGGIPMPASQALDPSND